MLRDEILDHERGRWSAAVLGGARQRRAGRGRRLRAGGHPQEQEQPPAAQRRRTHAHPHPRSAGHQGRILSLPSWLVRHGEDGRHRGVKTTGQTRETLTNTR